MKIDKSLLHDQLLDHLKTASFPGWAGGDESPVTQKDYEKAIYLVEIFSENISHPDSVFPEEDGTFHFFWGSQNGNLRIFIDDDGSWAAMICNKEHYCRFYNFIDKIPEIVLARLQEIADEDQ